MPTILLVFGVGGGLRFPSAIVTIYYVIIRYVTLHYISCKILYKSIM